MLKKSIVVIILCLSVINGNPFKGFTFGYGRNIGMVAGAAFYEVPNGQTIFLEPPFGLSFGSSDLSLSLVYGSYSSYAPSLFGLGFNLNLVKLIFAEFHYGKIGQGTGFRGSLGITFDRLMKGLPVTASIGNDVIIAFDPFVGSSYASTYWGGLVAKIEYPIGGKENQRSGRSGSGPSAKVDSKGGATRPGATGSSEIDNFVTAAFDLNDKIGDLKEKLESVSNGLNKSNAVLADIGNSSSGPIGWAMMELQKGMSKSKNSITAAVQALQSDVPDLPEIYFGLIKESLTAPETLAELVKGTQPEQALVLTFNKKAKEKGVPTTSKEWIMSLNLELDPTKTLRTKLDTINEGVLGGKDKLVSVPDDLKAIGGQAQSLMSSAAQLPKAAKSLGMKAPKALKAIKATTDVLKNIPNEVKSIGDETKKVMEEIDQVLKNIKEILS